MPVILPQSFLDAIEQPRATNALLWFVELQLARPYLSGATVIPSIITRLTSYHDQVAWPAGSPDSETWYPYNFSISPIEQGSEGDLPQLDLTVDNTARLLMRYLHDGDGFEGNSVALHLVAENGLAIAYPNHEAHSFTFQIAGAIANEESVTFRLERANMYQRTSPSDRYAASRCRWAFGGDECGYVVNDVAAYTSCPKTLDACIARGADHAARGLPVLHPRRFGGFPGIPRQR